MSTYVNILFTIFLLLPGFVALRIQQSTSEYRELSAFEFTTISLGYSFVILAIWILENYSLSTIHRLNYDFFEKLEELLVEKDLEVLFSSFSAVLVLTYLNAFICFALFVFNLHWIGLGRKILRKIGLTRFTAHLTPWEDFQILSRLDWVAIELKDGRTFLGKLGLGSHLPFEKEIVIKRVDKSPVTIYDTNKAKVNVGQEIELSYVKGSEIRAMHTIKDPDIVPTTQKAANYFLVAASLLLAIVALCMLFVLVVLSVGRNLRHSPLLNLLLLPIAAAAVLWNLWCLRKFN